VNLNKSHIISTDEDPGLRIESFAVINLRGVSTNKTIIYFIAMQTYKELNEKIINEILPNLCRLAAYKPKGVRGLGTAAYNVT
jgi:hypothetical protein